MGPSLPALPLIVTLFLGLMLSAQAFDLLDYCRPPKICPIFTRISTNQNYEERVYEPTVWTCTEVKGIDRIALTRASIHLMYFWKFQRWARGVEISLNTWPSLAIAEQVRGGLELNLCWLVPPGLTVSSYDTVTVKTFPRLTMFVRSFGGIPTFESARLNLQRLMEDLISDGKNFDPTLLFGASYDQRLSRTRHNEVLISKDLGV